jgi:hypothetical protein
MHKKEVCIKCHRYHERPWKDSDEAEWLEGCVACPVENFEVLRKNGVSFRADKHTRNLFGAIFGGHGTSEEIPAWCPFKDEHKEAGA